MALSATSTQEEKNDHYRAALTAYTAAVSAHDVDAVLRLYADDAEIEDPVGSGRWVRGMDEIRPFYTRVLKRDIKMSIYGHIAGAKSNVACAPIRVDVEGSVIHAICLGYFNEAGLMTKYFAYWGPGDIEGTDPSTGVPVT